MAVDLHHFPTFKFEVFNNINILNEYFASVKNKNGDLEELGKLVKLYEYKLCK